MSGMGEFERFRYPIAAKVDRSGEVVRFGQFDRLSELSEVTADTSGAVAK